MNEEELKAGERYNFTLIYTGQSINNKFRFESPTGIHYILGLGDIEAVSPVSAPENAPCRELRIGDKVRVRKIHGKLPQCRYNGVAHVKEGDCCTIFEDAYRNCYWVTMASNVHWCFDAAYLELVTPVEEIQQFFLESDNNLYFCIYFGTSQNYELVSRLRKKHYSLTEAEAECARLNAKYRKEQK